MVPPPRGVIEAAASLGELRRLRMKKAPPAENGFRRGARNRVALKAGGPAAHGLLELLLRPLTIVGGKGGVGKTTISCALAIAAAVDATTSGDVLLVSTDPAPSLGDALGYGERRWAQDAPEPIASIPRLHAWQMDATAAFHALRERYRDRIDALFDSLMGRNVDAAHDRAILRDLLSLAPPGIDELYALASIGEEIETQRYAQIIVDPAPTGHLLRLLELPPLAIDWSHRLMRLILKYREIAGLGEAAQELLTFSRRTRALNALLHDQARAGIVLVTLDEAVVHDETARLSAMLSASGVKILGEVMNRAPKGAGKPARLVVAPEWPKPLVGASAIQEWWGRWQRPVSA
jgi:arsenite-transporting ATPase